MLQARIKYSPSLQSPVSDGSKRLSIVYLGLDTHFGDLSNWLADGMSQIEKVAVILAQNAVELQRM